MSSVKLPASGSVGPSACSALLVLAGVRHVLADALVTAALEVDHGREAREVVRGLHLERLEPVRLDLERQVADAVVGRHPPGTVRVLTELVY